MIRSLITKHHLCRQLDESLRVADPNTCRDGRSWQNRRKRKLREHLKEAERLNDIECLFEDDRRYSRAAIVAKEQVIVIE